MRRTALLACLAILAACGSSSSTSKGLNAAPTITVGGAAFAPADGGALTVTNKTCSTAGGPLNVSALLMGFSSFGGLCDFATKNGICASKQNAKFLSILVGSAGTAPAAIGPGTYPVGISATTIVSVTYDQSDATCSTTAGAFALSGSVTITQVTPTVKGSITAALVDAMGAPVGTISGNFDVATCNAAVDVCAMVNSSCTGACVP